MREEKTNSIYVEAFACPVVVRDFLLSKSGEKKRFSLYFVASIKVRLQWGFYGRLRVIKTRPTIRSIPVDNR